MECSSSNDNDNKKITVRLQSSDGQIMEVEEAVALQSGLIKAAIENVGAHATIPLPQVSATILAMVIKYCTMFLAEEEEREERERWYRRKSEERERRLATGEEDGAEKSEEERETKVREATAEEFMMKMDMATLCKLIDASEYLTIHQLQELAGRCCGRRITHRIMALSRKSRRSLSFPISMKEDG